MEITIGNSSDIISKAQSIRYQVFTLEQNIPQHLDTDGLDAISHHALATDGNSLVATARLHINEVGHSVMARVAVIKEYRGSGVASKVVKELLNLAHKLGVSTVEIHAHEYLRNFYEKFGFQFIRKAEVVGDHQLIEMRFQAASA